MHIYTDTCGSALSATSLVHEKVQDILPVTNASVFLD